MLIRRRGYFRQGHQPPGLSAVDAGHRTGKIQAVMFTELSRLSRSLKDFLNIFEFAQKNRCDLVCLKTKIDTTSPYKTAYYQNPDDLCGV